MRRKALRKDFDLEEVQDLGFPDVATLWSDEARAEFGEPADVHPDVAARLRELGARDLLDMGCGSGLLLRSFGEPWVGMDASILQLRQAPPGRLLLGDLSSLPFGDATFDAAATLYTLYFIEDVSAVADEAWRVLRPGGWFAVCAPSRFDAPEIDHFAPRDDVDAFASEDIEELLGERYEDLEMHPWDFPFLVLRDLGMAAAYIRFWYYPRFSIEEATELAATLELPLLLTKKGAWGLGRKPS